MDLWLPTSARPRYQCNVPDCGATFREDEREEYQRHVVTCANKNRSSLEQMAGEHRESQPFQGTPFAGPIDPEASSWLKQRFGRRRRKR